VRQNLFGAHSVKHRSQELEAKKANVESSPGKNW
jgi:hypothetical protein